MNNRASTSSTPATEIHDIPKKKNKKEEEESRIF